MPKSATPIVLSPDERQQLHAMRRKPDAFIAAYNQEAASFEWTKVNFRAKSLEGKYSNLCK